MLVYNCTPNTTLKINTAIAWAMLPMHACACTGITIYTLYIATIITQL